MEENRQHFQQIILKQMTIGGQAKWTTTKQRPNAADMVEAEVRETNISN